VSLTRSNLVRLGVRLNAKSGRYCTLQTQTALMPLIYKSETGVIVNSILSAKVTQSKAAGLAWVEVGVGRKVRFTLNCGGFDWIGKMAGKATRIGLYKCYQCRKQFTVKVGTAFEDSYVPSGFTARARVTVLLRAVHQTGTCLVKFRRYSYGD
jgi:hypothetical protein